METPASVLLDLSFRKTSHKERETDSNVISSLDCLRAWVMKLCESTAVVRCPYGGANQFQWFVHNWRLGDKLHEKQRSQTDSDDWWPAERLRRDRKRGGAPVVINDIRMNHHPPRNNPSLLAADRSEVPYQLSVDTRQSTSSNSRFHKYRKCFAMACVNCQAFVWEAGSVDCPS